MRERCQPGETGLNGWQLRSSVAAGIRFCGKKRTGEAWTAKNRRRRLD